MLESVPAGSYVLNVSTSRPRAGELLVFVGRASAPIQRLALKPLNRQSSSLVLPAGALGLTITPDPSLERLAGQIQLTPVRVITSDRLARSGRPYGSTRVFFLDDNVFVEDAGFWVRGGRSAEVLLEGAQHAPTSFTLVLQNGRAVNAVELAAGAAPRRETLRASETRSVDLMSDAAGALRLSIASSSGFRPSDDGASQDGRYLGVWVGVKGPVIKN